MEAEIRGECIAAENDKHEVYDDITGLKDIDETYTYSQEFRELHKNSWFSRGHVLRKLDARRIDDKALKESFSISNIAPQLIGFNNGVWSSLEDYVSGWANAYGKVWVITGPVFINSKPSIYIGEIYEGEPLVAVPDQFFKIVVKTGVDPSRPDVLAFLYPHLNLALIEKQKVAGKYDHSVYLKSVDEIEELTGLDFLTTLPENVQRQLERKPATELWPKPKMQWDRCSD